MRGGLASGVLGPASCDGAETFAEGKEEEEQEDDQHTRGDADEVIA